MNQENQKYRYEKKFVINNKKLTSNKLNKEIIKTIYK